MTDEISSLARLWRRESMLLVCQIQCVSRCTVRPRGCGCGGLVMCTEMDRWSDPPPMRAALVTEIVEQSISVATMSRHEKGVPRYR